MRHKFRLETGCHKGNILLGTWLANLQSSVILNIDGRMCDILAPYLLQRFVRMLWGERNPRDIHAILCSALNSLTRHKILRGNSLFEIGTAIFDTQYFTCTNIFTYSPQPNKEAKEFTSHEVFVFLFCIYFVFLYLLNFLKSFFKGNCLSIGT
jgi:hypothetical protein